MQNSHFWAKKDEKNAVLLWLPLYQHLEDTKEIAGFLWEHYLSEGQRKIINDSLDEEFKDRGKDVLLFLAATHDIGKATPAFQIKEGYGNTKDLDIRLLENLERDGFDGISSVYLAHPNKTPHNIAGQYLLHTYGVKDDLSTIIGGHHGKPINSPQDIENQKGYPSNYYQSEDKNSDIYKKWLNAQRKLFDWALELSHFKSVEDLPKVGQPAQVILSGLLIMADWIASNPSYFPLISIDSDEVIDREDRAKLGFSKWLKTHPWEADYIFDYADLYARRFGFEPRNIQSVLSETIENIEKPGIFILEAPMGSGKTEASLIACEQLAYKSERSGLFFGLPTQATSNGIFPRIINWLESIGKEQDEKMQLRLSHGKSYLNEQFIHLAKGVNIDEPDGKEDGSIIVNEWFSGRKTSSLDDFVVGTVDQFLMLALKQKHLALRHLGFSKKVVIIDEVHAYDAYMSQYLLQALRWMGAYRVPIVILSATLPAERRFELIKAYMSGRGVKWKKAEREALAKRLKSDDYPLITYSDGDEVGQIKDFDSLKNKKVRIIRLDEEVLFDLVEDTILNGGIVGIIVNTVKRAQTLARDLSDRFSEELVLLIHSAFIATDRIKKERDLIQMIGSKAERPFAKVVIGTQVIEQSLDIDFDLMISDLAPMDLLIQRMGRLHRHEIERPSQHKEAKFYVLGTNEDYDFEEGSSFVYGNFLLARTQYYLRDCIYLPMDISPLVQRVYDVTEDIEIESELSLKYEEFKREHEQKRKDKESKARVYRLSEPVLKTRANKKENLIGWLDHSMVNESEEKANAQVRDIEPTIEVIALKEIDDGYGIFATDKDISKDILDGEIGKMVAQNTLLLPRSLSKSYMIDKTIEYLESYNLQYLADWQKSLWLKGSLGIIFNEDNEFILGKTRLIYDEKFGLLSEKIEGE